jgi:hypothetical protein
MSLLAQGSERIRARRRQPGVHTLAPTSSKIVVTVMLSPIESAMELTDDVGLVVEVSK